MLLSALAPRGELSYAHMVGFLLLLDLALLTNYFSF